MVIIKNNQKGTKNGGKKMSDKFFTEEKCNTLKDLLDRIKGKKGTKPTKEEVYETLDSLGLLENGEMISEEEFQKRAIADMPKLTPLEPIEPSVIELPKAKFAGMDGEECKRIDVARSCMEKVELVKKDFQMKQEELQQAIDTCDELIESFKQEIAELENECEK